MALTRAQLRSKVRLRISDKAASNTDNFTDADLNDLLYSSVLYLQGEVEKLDQHYFEEETDLNVTSTDTEISLPTGFSVLINLRRIDNGQNTSFTIIDQREITGNTAQEILGVRKYEAYLTKSKIRYTAPLNEDHTVRLTFTKVLSDLANDTDSWDLHPYVEEAVVVKTVLLALGSENNNTAFWEKEWASTWAKITDNLKSRQAATPKHVRYIPR